MVKISYSAGDLVFAKVRGYPPWPARITTVLQNGKYAVFFYGTYENAQVKAGEVFPFTQENQDTFIPKNINRKNYSKGVDEIRNTPEIAPGPDEIPALGVTAVSSPKKVAVKTPASAASPAVVRKPLRLSDGTPLKREPGTPASAGGTDSAARRRGTKRSAEDSESEGGVTPQTSSRSGRVIKQKRFSDETSREVEVDQTKPRADLQIDDPRKIWVKKRTTGDMIEIQLDKEKPDRWESHEAKLSWLLSTARNAAKLKEFVELGEYIPTELVDEIKQKSELTQEDLQLLKKAGEQVERRRKMAYLLREQELVDININIRRALTAKNPDTDECVRQLQQLLQLELDQLMLLKQPDVIDTVRKVVRYQGPGEGLEPKDKDQRNVRSIQTMAETLYKKIQVLFKYKGGQGVGTFPDFVQKELDRFAEVTKEMNPSHVLALTSYPA